MVRVRARGEEFRIVRVVGNLLVCSQANGNCCCGWAEKGRMPFENAVWSDEWEKRRLRNRVHLTFTGCLGPCEVGNNVLLQIHGRSIWFKDLNERHLPGRVFDFIEATLAQGAVAPVPDDLAGHVFDRYLTPNDRLPGMTDADESSLPGPLDPEALDGLDPVCMMEVNPGTAPFTLEHAGRTIAFCGPGCRREFLEDPDAFLPGLTPR